MRSQPARSSSSITAVAGSEVSAAADSEISESAAAEISPQLVPSSPSAILKISGERSLRAGIRAVGGGDIAGAPKRCIRRSSYPLNATVHQATRDSPEVERRPLGRYLQPGSPSSAPSLRPAMPGSSCRRCVRLELSAMRPVRAVSDAYGSSRQRGVRVELSARCPGQAVSGVSEVAPLSAMHRFGPLDLSSIKYRRIHFTESSSAAIMVGT